MPKPIPALDAQLLSGADGLVKKLAEFVRLHDETGQQKSELDMQIKKDGKSVGQKATLLSSKTTAREKLVVAVKKAQSELENAGESRGRTNSELEAARKELTRLEGKLKEAESDLADAEREAKAKSQAKERDEQATAKAEQRRKDKKRAREKLQQQAEQQRRKVDDKIGDVKGAEKTEATARARLNELERVLAAAEDELKRLSKEHEAGNKELEKNKTESSKLADELRARERSVDDTSKQLVSELKSAANEILAKCSELTKECTASGKELSTLAGKIYKLKEKRLKGEDHTLTELAVRFDNVAGMPATARSRVVATASSLDAVGEGAVLTNDLRKELERLNDALADYAPLVSIFEEKLLAGKRAMLNAEVWKSIYENAFGSLSGDDVGTRTKKENLPYVTTGLKKGEPLSDRIDREIAKSVKTGNFLAASVIPVTDPVAADYVERYQIFQLKAKWQDVIDNAKVDKALDDELKKTKPESAKALEALHDIRKNPSRAQWAVQLGIPKTGASYPPAGSYDGSKIHCSISGGNGWHLPAKAVDQYASADDLLDAMFYIPGNFVNEHHATLEYYGYDDNRNPKAYYCHCRGKTNGGILNFKWGNKIEEQATKVAVVGAFNATFYGPTQTKANTALTRIKTDGETIDGKKPKP